LSIGSLGDLPETDWRTNTRGFSRDGSTIVGQGLNDDRDQEAYRWTQSGGFQGLGHLPGGDNNTGAIAANVDGSVIVGFGDTDRGTEAFIWTEASGIQLLQTVAGITDTELAGGILEDAHAISDDGLTIVGTIFYANDPVDQGDNERAAYLINLEGLPSEPTLLPQLIAEESGGQLELSFETATGSTADIILLQQAATLTGPWTTVITYDFSSGLGREVLSGNWTGEEANTASGIQISETTAFTPTKQFWRLACP
jgi:hypothetical protein